MFSRIVIGLFFTVICANDVPLIEISNGLLQGTFEKSYNGKIYSSFEGIPYARPPVGDLRFESPKEPYNWTGVWIADTKHICAQTLMLFGLDAQVLGDEDCLYISVYVPREKPNPSDNLNVIIHFHGGAFMGFSGHSYAGPKYLMDEDVIFVTMNYRLGPYGFLSTEDDVLPGNNGLKDQVLSLKWIQRNIKYFGGNPESVTLTGFSAGGASVHLHYFSPLSKGLFHRGFSESGCALNPWVFQAAAKDNAKRLAMLVGCPTETSKRIVDCLKSRSASKINEAVKEFSSTKGYSLAPFAPIIEVPNAEAFLIEHPYQMLKDNTVTDVPWVIAVAEQEAHSFAPSYASDISEFYQVFEKIASFLLEYHDTCPQKLQSIVIDKIKKHYLEGGLSWDAVGKLLGDRLFLAGADTAAKLQAKANKSPVYFYMLGYRGESCIMDMLYESNKYQNGAAHGDSLLYYLQSPVAKNILSQSDEKLKSIFIKWILAYADSQKPNIGDAWKPVEDDEILQYLYIGSPDDIYMKTDGDLGFNSFWKSLPLKENENYQIVKDEL